MKNTIKIVGVIVLVAVIGFSMASCFSLGGGSSSESSGSQSSSSSSTAGKDAWPSDDFWAKYYLSGLQQPSGTNVTIITLPGGAFTVALDNADKAAFDNLVGQVEKMSGWKVQDRKADAVSFVNGKAGLVIGSNSKDKMVSILLSI